MDKINITHYPLFSYSERVKELYEAVQKMLNPVMQKTSNYRDIRGNLATTDFDAVKIFIEENHFKINMYDAENKLLGTITKYNDVTKHFDAYKPYELRNLVYNTFRFDTYIGRSAEQNGMLQLNVLGDLDYKYKHMKPASVIRENANFVKMLCIIFLSNFHPNTKRLEIITETKEFVTTINKEVTPVKEYATVVKTDVNELNAFADFLKFLGKRINKSSGAAENYIKEHGEEIFNKFSGVPEEDPFKLAAYNMIDEDHYSSFEIL